MAHGPLHIFPNLEVDDRAGRPAAPPGVTRFVQTSTDLVTWTSGEVTEIPGGYEVPRDLERRYLRIVYEVVN